MSDKQEGNSYLLFEDEINLNIPDLNNVYQINHYDDWENRYKIIDSGFTFLMKSVVLYDTNPELFQSLTEEQIKKDVNIRTHKLKFPTLFLYFYTSSVYNLDIISKLIQYCDNLNQNDFDNIEDWFNYNKNIKDICKLLVPKIKGIDITKLIENINFGEDIISSKTFDVLFSNKNIHITSGLYQQVFTDNCDNLEIFLKHDNSGNYHRLFFYSSISYFSFILDSDSKNRIIKMIVDKFSIEQITKILDEISTVDFEEEYDKTDCNPIEQVSLFINRCLLYIIDREKVYQKIRTEDDAIKSIVMSYL